MKHYVYNLLIQKVCCMETQTRGVRFNVF